MANVKCAWAAIDENGKARGGKAGDQTGRECRVGSWYNFGQKMAYRWKDRKKAEEYAKIITAFCNNKNIGYDQNDRVTLFNILKENNWDYTKVNKPVECDCSEIVGCAINCVERKEVVPSWIYTGNLAALLEKTGLFESVLTGTKYCGKSDYLMIGDICNNPGRHVISAVEDGELAGKSSGNKVAEPTLRKGARGSQVTKLQRNLNTLKITDASGKALEADGIFGACTKEAVKKYQKKNKLEIDGIYGQKSYEKMKTLIK